MPVEMMRIKYKGKEDMIPWDYNGKRYTFSKKKPIKEYPAEAVNWLFKQKDRDWNECLKILPPETPVDPDPEPAEKPQEEIIEELEMGSEVPVRKTESRKKRKYGRRSK